MRGAGWTPQLFLERSVDSYRHHLALVRDMGLNTVRLEGKMEDAAFYETADTLGLLTMPGWACCDAWQHWPLWRAEQLAVAAASQHTQARRLRQYASTLAFFISSDELPPPKIESLYRAALAAEHWTAAIVQSAAVTNSTISGPSGVKMSG